MKIIELLNKIANGEAPTIIKFQNYIWTLNKQFKDYTDDERYLFCDYMPDVVSIEEFLNYEVEIIEEDKKIEKLEYELCDEDGDFTINGFAFDNEQKLQIIDKINEIIEELNRR